MPRNYKRKQGANYGSADPDELRRAVDAVQQGMSIRKAVAEFNVKKSTLHDHVTGKHIRQPGIFLFLFFIIILFTS